MTLEKGGIELKTTGARINTLNHLSSKPFSLNCILDDDEMDVYAAFNNEGLDLPI